MRFGSSDNPVSASQVCVFISVLNQVFLLVLLLHLTITSVLDDAKKRRHERWSDVAGFPKQSTHEQPGGHNQGVVDKAIMDRLREDARDSRGRR